MQFPLHYIHFNHSPLYLILNQFHQLFSLFSPSLIINQVDTSLYSYAIFLHTLAYLSVNLSFPTTLPLPPPFNTHQPMHTPSLLYQFNHILCYLSVWSPNQGLIIPGVSSIRHPRYPLIVPPRRGYPSHGYTNSGAMPGLSGTYHPFREIYVGFNLKS